MKMNKEFRQVDVALVVDTTGSMGNFIRQAKRSMAEVVESLSTSYDLDIMFGLVWYRDHCDRQVTGTYKFTNSSSDTQKYINNLGIDGGGDTPEAVFDGIKEMCELGWRKHSIKIGLLVGDAPPHGYGCSDDTHKKGCPCGLTFDDISAQMENKGIVLNAFVVSNDNLTKRVFANIAESTGGKSFVSTRDATVEIRKILEQKFKDVDLDIDIYNKILERQDVKAVAEDYDGNRLIVSGAISRLMSRKLLEYSQEQEAYVSGITKNKKEKVKI